MAMEKENLTHFIEDDLQARNRNWEKIDEHIDDGNAHGLDVTKQTFDAHLAESAAKHIKESGSNANGSYIKFDDGTMICAKRVEFSGVPVTQAWGSLFISPSTARIQLGAFAHAFIEVPVISLFMNFNTPADAWLGAVQGLTSSVAGATIIIRPTSLESLSAVINVVAIGRWK